MFENIPINKTGSENRKRDAGPKIDRRSVLKGIGAALVLAAGAEGASKIVSRLSDKFSSQEKIDSPERLADPSQELDEIRLNLRLETLEQARIRELDNEVAGRTLENQIETKGRITLDGATRQALYANWRKEYVPGGYSQNTPAKGGGLMNVVASKAIGLHQS